MNVTFASWTIVVGIIGVLIAVDLFTSSRNPREVKFKEASLWSIFSSREYAPEFQ
jgi:hypothetical protein